MDKLSTFWNHEPAVIIAFVRALLYALVTFGFQLSPDQIGAIILVVEGGLALWTRQSVVSPATHIEEVNGALNTPAPLNPHLVTEEAAL